MKIIFAERKKWRSPHEAKWNGGKKENHFRGAKKVESPHEAKRNGGEKAEKLFSCEAA
jgi:hypothetical protein